MSSWTSWLGAFFLTMLGVTAPAQEYAGQREAQEYAVKAAFLYNFAKFVTWPESAFETPRSPFRIGILGADPFGDALAEIVIRKKVAGRAIEIVRFDSPQDVGPVHILFVHIEDLTQFAKLNGQARRQHILTVGEQNGFLDAGGMIEMAVVRGFIELAINEAEAAQAELRISASLLEIAERVIPRPREIER